MTRLLTLFLVGGAFAVVGLVLLVGDRPTPEIPPPPPPLPPAVVTMGDSTLSGEGAGNYVPGTDGANGNWCHRSPAAPVHQLRLPGSVKRINLACSGAKAGLVGLEARPNHPEGSQARRLADIAERYRITDIVVQVGANDDPSFVDVLNKCVGAWVARAPGGCAEELRQEWPKRVQRMQPKVLDALRDIRTVMDRAGYERDGYSLVVQSYASPVGPGIAPELQDLSGCPLLTSDVKWVRSTAVPQLSEGLREVAEQVGARFLDLSRAGYGHEACTGGDKAPGTEWFTRLTVDWQALKHEKRAPHAMQESFHANATGHAQFARCLSDFLTGTRQQAVCLPDSEGNLTAVSPEVAAQRTSR
ncbi:lysophospholipase L1-like esterase [Haloactinomyces albus]|uniref:Lysophospholipase L1-like esterase n=1 Tax=Haloactinomyces albus TaxID=1352928 RepID=A0AAE3ZGI3_9ACTN|nr:GDSL-type esterase/lipase family protein [Haloactinomyces albus]MDR7303481.1 lysophospholipase L1-like esterase [Haloactinomyces albus]